MNMEKELSYMKTLFKIMVYPIIILLWAVIKLGSAITYISGLALGIVSAIFALTGLVFLITGSAVNGVIGLVLAYLFGPYGIPMFVIMILGFIRRLKDNLQSAVC